MKHHDTSKKCYMWDLTGKLVAEYDSAAQAASRLKYDYACIMANIHRKTNTRTYRGFIFSQEPEFPGYHDPKVNVYRWDLDGTAYGLGAPLPSGTDIEVVRKRVRSGKHIFDGYVWNTTPDFPHEIVQKFLRTRMERKERAKYYFPKRTPELIKAVTEANGPVEEIARKFDVAPHIICQIKGIPYNKEDYYK